MNFTSLWQRYFLSEILKVFFLCLSCFFFLYALVDYSMHMQEILKNQQISFLNLICYYGMLFSKRCNLLLPLSLLIASVKVLTSLNQKNELLTLQTAAIPIHVLTRPFFFVALICVGLSYVNYEVLAPRSLSFIDHFEKKFLKKKKSWPNKNLVYTLALEDGSRLIYQKYNEEKTELHDVFWVISLDTIYHIKTLTFGDPIPVGFYVDFMKRNERNCIEKIASYDHYPFDTLPLNSNSINQSEKLIQHHSISDLLQMISKKTSLFHENRSIVHTHLYFKLLMPWLPVLILIGTIPFCIRSARNSSTFMIFSFTIFGYITFFTMMDACVILGEMQVIPPFWAIFTLPILLFCIFGFRFFKICIRSK